MNPEAHLTRLPRAAPARVLACGAFLKNRAALVDGDRVLWSAGHGDLGDAAARVALARALEALLAQAGGPVHAVAHDLHPDVPSTALARALAARLDVPAIAVQHHHAHAGVVLAEQGLAGRAVALALDGYGFGSDGGAWGGELLAIGPGPAWQRLGHLPLLALPGGDAAARAPWRLAAAVLHALGRGDEIVPRFADAVGAGTARGVQALLQRGLHCPPSSSAGRWFDAAAGALRLSVRQAHEAEAAVALEALAATWLHAHPGFDVDTGTLDLHAIVGGLFDVPQAEAPRAAALFHATLAAGLAQRAAAAAEAHGTQRVLLVGGCFANRVLSRLLRQRLQRTGLDVLMPQAAGCGDEGLALGQAWIAACTVAALAAQPATLEA